MRTRERLDRVTLRGLLVTERPFLAVLALGVLARVVVQLAFPPAFVFSDGPVYLGFVDDLTPSPDRPLGYGYVLWALAQLTRAVWLVAVAQHLLGLLTAVALYAVLRRRGVSSLVGALACLPVLLDQMQLVLEHSVLSDTVFGFLLVAAVAALGWSRTPGLRAAALGGLLLGMAVVVRVVGEPALLAAVVFLLVAAGSWRVRVARVALLTVAALVPVAAYAAVYEQANGPFAVTQASGRALFMRVTTFVDCDRVDLPSYERTLCPREPLGERLEPTYYGWHDPRLLPALKVPAGMTRDEVLHDFATRAIGAQPLDYARTVARDGLGGFAPERVDAYEYYTAFKWTFAQYVDDPPTPWTGPAYAAHGGQQLDPRRPLADTVASVSEMVYLPGPVVALLALLGVVGLVRRGRVGAPQTRSFVLLLLLLGIGLPLVPDVTAEFVWRYQLPGVVLLPAAAALAWTRLRWRAPVPDQSTTATPRIDCPNGTRTRRSTNRVVGTTTRS